MSNSRPAVVILAFLTLLLHLPCPGNDPVPAFQFEHLNTDHGLSQNSVVSILQTSDGFIWFGTYTGLNRFDGHNFRTYNHRPGDESSLSGPVVRSLCEDHEGNLWVATTHGLNRYLPEKDQFERYLHDPDDPHSLSNNYIFKVYCDVAGTVWAGTFGGGLNQVRHAPAGSSKPFQFRVIDPGVAEENVDDQLRIAAIGETASGELLVGASLGFGIVHSIDQPWKLIRHSPEAPHSISYNNLSAITKDHHGQIWVGTWGSGLKLFLPEQHQFVSVPDSILPPGTRLSDARIMTLFCDSKGMLWVSSWGEGLFRITLPSNFVPGQDPDAYWKKATVHYFQPDPSDVSSLSGTHIYSIYEDRSGILWMGTSWRGLNKLNLHSQSVRHFSSIPLNPNSLSDNVVFSVHVQTPDLIWIGTLDGLNLWDRKANTFHSYQRDTPEGSSLWSNTINALVPGEQNSLWVGTNRGLNQLDLSTGNLTAITFPSRRGLHILSMTLSAHDGSLWIGTFNQGLSQYNPHTGSLWKLPNTSALAQAIGMDPIRAIVEDRHGNLWLGTDSHGVCVYDPIRRSLHNHTWKAQSTSSLASQSVQTLAFDTSGHLWVGTSNGLCRSLTPVETPGTPLRFQTFTTDDGLVSDRISGLVPTPDGNLWITSAGGINQYRASDQSFTRVDLKHGIRRREYLDGAIAHIPETGELLAGSTRGVTLLHPAFGTEVDTGPDPTVAITALLVANKPVSIGETINGRVLLSRAIEKSTHLSLTHRDNAFGFEFAALHFSAPDLHAYSFMLEGFDSHWNEVGSRRNANYTNLRPGNYTFHVRAANPEGNWTSTPTSLAISILPAWWDTPVFRISLAILILVIFVLLYRWRVRSLHLQQHMLSRMVDQRTAELSEMNTTLLQQQDEISQQNEALNDHRINLERMIDERTRELRVAKEKAEESDRLKSAFLANISHEVRTPMNAIVGFSSCLLQEDSLTPEDRAKFTGLIRKGCDSLLSIINNVLDLALLECGQMNLILNPVDIEALLRDLHNHIQHDLPANIGFILEIDPTTPLPIIQGDHAKIRQVLNNLLENAFKFTQEGTVTLEVTHHRGWLHFLVHDTGPGIEERLRPLLFSPFNKYDFTQNQFFSGAGMGLAICRKLSDLMGGILEMQSTSTQGSTFRFSLPCGDEPSLPAH